MDDDDDDDNRAGGAVYVGHARKMHHQQQLQCLLISAIVGAGELHHGWVCATEFKPFDVRVRASSD